MRKRWVVGFILWGILLAGTTLAQESQAPLTLEESIKIALDRNLAPANYNGGRGGFRIQTEVGPDPVLPDLDGTIRIRTV